MISSEVRLDWVFFHIITNDKEGEIYYVYDYIEYQPQVSTKVYLFKLKIDRAHFNPSDVYTAVRSYLDNEIQLGDTTIGCVYLSSIN